MKILKKMRLVIQCPVCHTVYELQPEDIRHSIALNGVFQCKACKYYIIVYTSDGELTRNAKRVLIEKENSTSNK